MAGGLSASAANDHAPVRPGARKTRAAAVSIASNMTLIVLKVVAGVITGSVAIITEAMHSSVDLLASVIAYVSVRKADEPADEDHLYGHEKIENLAAVIEGMLILVGSGIIIFEATRRLAVGAEVQRLGFGIAVVAFSMVANIGVSAFLRRRARDEASVALEGDAAHLSTDAATSGAVLVGLLLVEITGARWLDSVVAFYSVRKADEPADESHPYGHQKVENLAAAIEGMLILLGAGLIVFESVRRLARGAEVESLGVGIAVIGFSVLANLAVSTYLYRRGRTADSPALEGDAAHLRADAFTSLGVLVGLSLVQITGTAALDPATALIVAGAIVYAGLRILGRSSRVLVDEALPPEELDAVRLAIRERGADEVVGFHKLRARRAGSRRYVDLHVQFREGTTLRRAHEISHQLQGAIRSHLRGADVLIHLEPEPGSEREDAEGVRTRVRGD